MSQTNDVVYLIKYKGKYVRRLPIIKYRLVRDTWPASHYTCRELAVLSAYECELKDYEIITIHR